MAGRSASRASRIERSGMPSRSFVFSAIPVRRNERPLEDQCGYAGSGDAAIAGAAALFETVGAVESDGAAVLFLDLEPYGLRIGEIAENLVEQRAADAVPLVGRQHVEL